MNIITQETPGKVMGLVGACMFSMLFLFAVSITNQSFTNSEFSFPNPFSPENVVAVLDSTAHSYGIFVADNFTGPLNNDLASLNYNVHENLAFVMDNSSDQILAMTGLSDLVWQEPSPMAHPAFHSHSGSVAGAFTMRTQ